MLKEEIRRYKGRAKDAERLTAQQEQQLASLQEQVGPTVRLPAAAVLCRQASVVYRKCRHLHMPLG